LWLDVDPVRMGQVVSNLLSNAARYTDPGGYLELHAFVEDERLVVRVIDNGRGIPEALMGRIFDPFVQERVGTGGLGIGLTLVQRLTELHGGSVDAYSRGRGRGSSFTLNLPAPDLAPRQTTPGSGTAALTRGLRVLVVDDSRDIRESLGELIATWGHHVALADNGDDALALLLHDCPDVAIIDLALPGIDGYAIAERVRAAALARPPTLIALTGFGGEQLRRRALAAGFDEHVVKPPEPRALRALLRGQPPLTQRSHHVNP
jgi:CheY-like chemotaxis protein